MNGFINLPLSLLDGLAGAVYCHRTSTTEDYGNDARQVAAVSGNTKTTRPLPTAEQVQALLDYDPETGEFRWRKANSTRVRVGDVAGTHKPNGYLHIGVNCRILLGHRLAWLWVHGEWPAGHIDHLDGNPLNNAISNLREVTSSGNMHNRRKEATRSGRPTSSKYLGVSWQKKTGSWLARIGLNGKQLYIGTFATEEAAYAAYLAAKAELHPTQPVPRESAYRNPETLP
ncbi:HNH endonuclease [Xanthomonas translucens]|uniref:HNH endonuclease n=1 Tax=Xanthomonas campestris pv. translucens TaxID=343 RepID=UPI0009BEAB82|nr:HNH endonuclease [Xanthomonas translucens]